MIIKKQTMHSSHIKILQVILVVILFSLAWIISGWNTYNTDLYNYEIRYSLVEINNLVDSNYGISLLFYLLKTIGLDFFYSRIIIYGVFYSIMSFLLLKLCRNAFIAFALYLGFQLVRDTVEMKNYMALVSTFLSIFYLMRKDLKYRIISFLLLLVAGSFHVAYYVLLLMPLFPLKKKIPMLPFLVGYIILSFVSNVIIGNLMSFYSTSFIEERVDDLMRYSGYGAFFASTIVVTGSMLVFYLFYKKTLSIKGIIKINVNGVSYKDYSVFMYNLNVIGASLLIFGSITFSFVGRLYAVFILMNIIYCINYFELKKIKLRDTLNIVFLIYYAAIILFITMSREHYDDVFSYNLIIHII